MAQSKSAERVSKVQQANEILEQEETNEKVEYLLRKFKNQCKKSGKFDELRMHRYFMSKKERRILKAKLHSLK